MCQNLIEGTSTEIKKNEIIDLDFTILGSSKGVKNTIYTIIVVNFKLF